MRGRAKTEAEFPVPAGWRNIFDGFLAGELAEALANVSTCIHTDEVTHILLRF